MVSCLEDPKDGKAVQQGLDQVTPVPRSSSRSSRPNKEDKGKAGKGLKAKNKNGRDKQSIEGQKRGRKRPLAEEKKDGQYTA